VSGLKDSFLNGQGAMSVAGIGLGVADALMGEKEEYSGDKGGVTKGLDKVYDVATTAVGTWNPAVGLAMQGLKTLGKGVEKLGAYTSGMTTQDAILGSSFFNWNIGALNGAVGNNTNSYFSNS